jgi:hypothetical protein
VYSQRPRIHFARFVARFALAFRSSSRGAVDRPTVAA